MKVILSVATQAEGPWRDLELPADRPLVELLPLVLGALGQESHPDWELWAAPPGRRLILDQSLAAAAVWSGSWLLVRPVSA